MASKKEKGDSVAGKRSRVTIMDVAQRANVDQAVVSKVLRNDPGLRVRDETRQRVIDIASQLRYSPNIYARNLATARTGAFGLLVPDFRNPLNAEIIAGAEAVATERDLLLWTASSDGYGSEQYAAVVNGGLVDALLIAGVRTDEPLRDLVTAAQIPTLLVNRRSPDADRWVILEDQRAASLATDHLIALGHRKIGFVGGPTWADNATRRMEGFRASMEAANIELDERLVVSGNYSSAGGAEAVKRLLARGEPPTALVVAYAIAALGAWRHLHDCGFSVPGDISIVGIHQLPLEQQRVPALTCVRLPLRLLGRTAAQLVLDTPADEPIHAVVKDKIAVVTGGTAGPPRPR
ncbi:MAG TPA: LacI family transcriptional regulator [Actinobacteria bacterium]|nr:LacI family transcriptional regulator [Actinomycetota bacterium]